MRVLLTAYPEPPIWTFVSELCRGLERDGVHIVLAVLHGPLYEEQRSFLRSLRNVQFQESTFRAEWHNCDAYEARRAGEWLLGLARDFDVDIVHLNEHSFAGLSWQRPVLVNIVRASVPVGQSGAFAPGALTAPTSQLLDQARALYSTPSALVIPFGRSSDVLTDCGKEPLVVATAESPNDYGAIAAAVRVAARVSWPLFVIGATPVVPAGTSLANTHFMGALPDADRTAVLNRASVFVQTMDAASYGPLDAALCGCALVLADSAELREQWDGAAAFVAPDDDETLRSTLIWLIEDVDARNDLALRARHRAQTFSAERMAAAYLSTYIDLALKGPALEATISPSRST